MRSREQGQEGNSNGATKNPVAKEELHNKNVVNENKEVGHLDLSIVQHETDSNILVATVAPSTSQPVPTNRTRKKRNTEECLAIWKTWVPMDPVLHESLQWAQIWMLQSIDELFAGASVPYWICGGTLMGVLRHNGRLIPHDDDIDMECYEDDLTKLTIAIQNYNETTQSQFDIDLVYHKGSKTWEGHPVANLTFLNGLLDVDIFPRPRPLPAQQQYFPSEQEVYPLSRYALFDDTVNVWGPNQVTCGSYLDRCYGPDWRETVCVWNHDFNSYQCDEFDPRKELLYLDEYEAIVAAATSTTSSVVAAASAQATFQSFLSHCGGLDHFREHFKAYMFQRTWRRNRAAADFRDKQCEANFQHSNA